jgi:NAD dependent epimerase/dehydratase family enzyme
LQHAAGARDEEKILNSHSIARGCDHRQSKTTAKPKFLINASAIGYYGAHGDETLTEKSAPGKVSSHRSVQIGNKRRCGLPLGCRVVLLRSGTSSAARWRVSFMLGPFKCVGGPWKRQQWMSWIHIEDEVELIRFLIENGNAHGPINATALIRLRTI